MSEDITITSSVEDAYIDSRFPSRIGGEWTHEDEQKYQKHKAEFDHWLLQIKAAAWEAGCMAGRSREHHKNMTDEQSAEVWPNPYKEQP